MTAEDEAQRWYQEALRREAEGDREGALVALNVALRLRPEFPEADQARERLLSVPEPPPEERPPAAAPGPTGRQRLLEYDVAYPERLSRWRIFVKWLLAVPHIVVLYLLNYVVSVVVVVAWFAVLFTGRYPRTLFSLVSLSLRWTGNVAAYVLLRDEYPPFGDGAYGPVRFVLEEPERLSRWLLWVKWLLAIPNAVAFSFVQLTFLATVLMALVAVPLTGRYPEGLFRFAVGTVRWQLRLTAYLYFLTDRYPPFDMRAADPTPAGDLPRAAA